MTENEWLHSSDPQRMLEHILKKASERKLRLFACACGRRAQSLLKDNESHTALDLAEQFADGQVAEADLQSAWVAASHVKLIRKTPKRQSSPEKRAAWLISLVSNPGIRATVSGCAGMAQRVGHLPQVQERWRQIIDLHEIFGNPFHPVELSTAWLTPTVVRMAQVIYEQKQFEDMPIFGDALEEAGCTHDAILEHCRHTGSHVRGCWALDLVLRMDQ